MVYSLQTKKIETPNANLFLNSEINVRCLLGAFMMGTGAGDVGKFMSMIGVGGGVAFERQFYFNNATACEIILRRCRTIVRKAMLQEIAMTMREQYNELLSEEVINLYETLIVNDKLQEIPSYLPCIAITIS